MADCELEDGEVLDSDTDDPITSGAQAQAPPLLTHAEPRQRYPNPSIYRDRTRAAVPSSDSNDDSDEEKFLWKRKRLKYAAAKERDGSGDSRFGSADHSNVVSSWPPSNKGSGFPSVDILKPKKKKDIWGAVLQEQTLSQGFIGFDMEKKSKGYNDRSVEAYAFERAETDSRPWFIPEDDVKETENKSEELFSGPPDLDKLEENFMGAKKQGTKRKYPVKERLGPREYNKRKSRDHFKATASDPVKVVTEAVANRLQEPRNDLLLKVVRTMGRKKTLELAYITEDIEATGGMLTNDGSRRRTPGGVFFQLLKTDPSFTKDKMKNVFGEEMKKEAKRRKKLRAKRFKQAQSKKKDVSAEDGDTMEMESVADASLAGDESLNKNNSLDDDCDDENSNESSRGSSDTSNCPDPATMDLSELLKHHVESRRAETEAEEKKSAENKEKGMEQASSEMQPQEQMPILEPEISLDDESEMTFDL